MSDNNNASEYIKLDFIEIEQPIGKFYIASIKAEDLIYISKNDIRRIENEESNKLEAYFGIQRTPSPKRVKEIAEYVKYKDASFPTNIVIAIDSSLESDEERNIKIEDGILFIKKSEKIAQIIDGQHRLLGLKKAIDDDGMFADISLNFQLAVTIFIDMDIENQSMIFSTINKAQTKVNKSLVFDLYDLAKTRSPYRTAHNVVRVLNENDKSPFKDKIKMLGTANSSEETIAQATFVECITQYISKDPMKDRNLLMINAKIQDLDSNRYFFRDFFKNNNDIEIAVILVNYFNAIKDVFIGDWEKDSIIVKSTGVIAFMKLLKDIVLNKTLAELKTKDNFKEIIKRADSLNGNFTNENYHSGGVGQAKLYDDLKTLCFSNE